MSLEENLSSTVKIKKEKKKKKSSFLSILQKIGKSLVFPIAVLPAAALFLRIGDFIFQYGSIGVGSTTGDQFVYWFGWILKTPGSIVFDNLAIIFGVGVAFGFANDHRGEAALVGLLGYFGLIALVQNENSLSSLMYQNVLTTTFVDNLTGQATTVSSLLYLVTTWTDPISGKVVGQSVWLLNLGVFGGISVGLLAAFLYNKYSNIKLPAMLGFFSGRRFVPIAMLVSIIGVSFVFAAIWPWFQLLLIYFSQILLYIPALGAGLYVTFNRLLIPTGLHQVLNVFLWFQMPITFDGTQIFIQSSSSSFVPLFGDINAFLSSTSSVTLQVNGATLTGIDAFSVLQQAHVGTFQTGFFPIMMFGLPALSLAIANNAEKQYKKQIFAFVISASLVSFLTGITEPLEFSFMFVSPLLYLVYAVLSGIVASLTVLTGASIGFGFSAGFIDFALSTQISSNLSHGISSYANGFGGMINVLAIGIICLPVYYFITDFLIKKMDLATPGRKGNLPTGGDEELEINNIENSNDKNLSDKWFRMAINTIKITGLDNITEIDNCITRVRLTVKDNSEIEQNDAKKIGYTGMIKPGKTAVQYIIGSESEIIAKHMKEIISNFDLYKIYFDEKPNDSSTTTNIEQINSENLNVPNKEKHNSFETKKIETEKPFLDTDFVSPNKTDFLTNEIELMKIEEPNISEINDEFQKYLSEHNPLLKIEAIAQNLEESIQLDNFNVDRIELVKNLSKGGLTPDKQLAREVCEKVKIPVYVMVRPKDKSFIYSDKEFKQVLEYIEFLKNQTKAKGIVFGSLTKDKKVNTQQLQQVIEKAGNLKITFHRAIDEVENYLEEIVNLNNFEIENILTSGQRKTAIEGIQNIISAVSISNHNIIPGSGLSYKNVDEFLNLDIQYLHFGTSLKENEKISQQSILKIKGKIN